MRFVWFLNFRNKLYRSVDFNNGRLLFFRRVIIFGRLYCSSSSRSNSAFWLSFLTFNLLGIFNILALLFIFFAIWPVHLLIVMPENLFISSLSFLFLSYFFINFINFFEQIKDFLILIFFLVAYFIILLGLIIRKGYYLNSYVLTALVEVLLWQSFPSQVCAKSLIFFLIQRTEYFRHSWRFYLSHQPSAILRT